MVIISLAFSLPTATPPSENGVTFHLQQLPMSETDTQMHFQGHFVCSNASPCEASWPLTWTGFDPAAFPELQLTSVYLVIYDIISYAQIAISLTDPAELRSFSTNIDFSGIPNAPFTVYGILSYSRPVKGYDGNKLISELAIKVAASTRYRFTLLPAIFSPFSLSPTYDPNSMGLTEGEVHTTLEFTARRSPTTTTSVSPPPPPPPPLVLSQSTFSAASSDKLNTDHHYVFLSPAFTFRSPFITLPQEQKDAAIQPGAAPIFNQIWIELFGWSKWQTESTFGDNSNAFTPYCYINGVPTRAVIDIASQSQSLALLISPYIYNSVFIPMLKHNQSEMTIQCNGNFWIYYHPVQLLPETCLDSKTDNDSKSNDFFTPRETLSIYFLTIGNTGETAPRNVQNTHQGSDLAASWLFIAEYIALDSTMFYCTERRHLTTPKLNLLSSTIMLHNSIDLPWVDSPEYFQAPWVKCTYSLDLTDTVTEFKFDPRNNDVFVELDSTLRYSTTRAQNGNVDKLYGQQALLVISPSAKMRSEFDAASIMVVLPQKLTSGDGIEYSTESTLLLDDDLQQMFTSEARKKLQDYSYLQEQTYTLYYAIDRDEIKTIDPTTLQCGLDVRMTWNHHKESTPLGDSQTKSLRIRSYNNYSPLVPQVIYPTSVNRQHSAFSDDLNEQFGLPSQTAPTLPKITEPGEYPVDPIRYLHIERTDDHHLNITMNVTLFDELIAQQIDYLSIHSVDGISMFYYDLSKTDEATNQSSQAIVAPRCLTNDPLWTVALHLSSATYNTVRLQFLYNATHIESNNITANSIDNFNVLCPNIYLNSTRVNFETISKGAKNVKTVGSFYSFDIYNTLLFHFQFRNKTHYNIRQYNISNPYETDSSERALAWLIIVIVCSVAGVILLAIIAVALSGCFSVKAASGDELDHPTESINDHPLSGDSTYHRMN